jgi:hypothetical protein
MTYRRHRLCFAVLTLCGLLFNISIASAELVGYWSANSTGGVGSTLPNDQGNRALDGELFNATYSGTGQGHTGQPGDYAISFPGEDDDYAVLPATDRTFEEITLTAWVNGFQNGAWAGILVSRAAGQAIGIDFHDFNGELNYIWNNNSPQTWNYFSGLAIPEDEWTFVALTIVPESATLWVGPKGGALESSTNEIEHFPQDNFHEWRLAEDDCCDPNRNFSGLIDDVSIWDQALAESDLRKLHDLTATPLNVLGGIAGDFNNDDRLDVLDIDLLTAQVRTGNNNATFDITNDGQVDDADRRQWVITLRKTWFGDANMDGEFSSTDFVLVFEKGEYEDGIDNNSTWSDGDWNGDGNFGSSDFVVAFQDGGYEQGPRPGVAAVPEPAGWGMLLVGAVISRRLSRAEPSRRTPPASRT